MINSSTNTPTNHHKLKESVRTIQKLSFAEEGHPQSSVATIAGITNTMVGSVCLVVPHVFLYNGIITCILVMLVLGMVQCKTCQLFILHQKDSESDSEHMIKRLLGKNWTKIFRIASGTLLFVVGVIYFQLINLTLFPILELIFLKTDFNNYASPSEGMVFNKYSVQWQAIILFLPLSCMLLFKNITKLIKLAHYGVVAILAYCLFIVYIFISNILDDNFSQYWNEIQWFTWNFSQPAGQFALAFMVHNTIGQLMKNNENKDNNTRDLALSYSMAASIYGTIGIFGAIGLLGKEAIKPQTILDFFDSTDIAVLVIEGLFLIHLITAFPIFPYISKLQILEAFYKTDNYPKWLYWGFSAFFMVSCLIVQILSINVGIVIAFDGAVCGFLLVYIIPIYLHFKCYYGKHLLKVDEEQNLFVDAHLCTTHPTKDLLTLPLRVTFYVLLTSVGLYNLIIQFYDIIN